MDDSPDTPAEPLLPEEWAAATLLALGGFVATLALPVTPDGFAASWKRMYEEIGVPLSVPLQLTLELSPQILAPVLGLCGAAGLIILGQRGVARRWRLWVAGALAAIVLVLVAIACAAQREPLELFERLEPPDERGLPTVPGRTSEIAEAVERCVRDGLARGARPVGAGRARYAMLAGGPFPPLPDRLPAYEEARGTPGGLLLPWGPEGNREWSADVDLHWPAGDSPAPPLAEVEAAQAGRPQAWIDAMDRQRTDRRGMRVAAIPAVVDWPGGEGFSWSLGLGRARIELGGPEFRGAPVATQPYSDELLRVRVYVLRGFDRAAAAGPPEAPLPTGNVPVEQFVFLVGVP